jgi:cytidylate kinase
LAQEPTPHIRLIAISRQRGTGGAYVGRAVAERLNRLFIDREMLRVACEYESERKAQQASASEAPWWMRLAQSISFGSPEYGYVPPSSEAIYEGELFGIEDRLVQEIADNHPAVIVGRGVAQTMAGKPGVLSVFLHSPDAVRIARVQEIYKTADRRTAEQMVRDSDRDRARFIRALVDRDWTDVRNYDLTFNTASVGLDVTVDLIVRAVEARGTVERMMP